MICLDTNAVIAAINGRPPEVRTRLEAEILDGETICVSAVVLYELHFGIARSARPRANAARLDAFLTLDVTPLPFDEEDAEAAGDIRADLEGTGMPIGAYDTLIAAQARRRGAVLVTANTTEFARVPGLRVENWVAE